MVFTQEMQLLTYYPKMKKWSAIPVRSPNKQGYRAALTWENAVYLIGEFHTFDIETGVLIFIINSFLGGIALLIAVNI